VPVFDPLVQQRLCIALSAAAVLGSAESCQLFLQEAMAMAGAGGTPTTPPAITIALEMLKQLPVEKEAAGIPLGRKNELQLQLLQAKDHIWQLFDYLMSTQDQPAQRILILNCIQNWVKLGVSLSQFGDEHAATFRCVLQSLSASPELAKSASAILMDAIGINEYPRPQSRNAAVLSVVEGILSAQGLYAAAVHSDDEDTCHALTQLLVEIVDGEAELLVRAANEQVLQLVDFALQCTGQPRRNIASLVLDCWLRFQDIPLEERHPDLGAPLYLKVLQVLLLQCTYPQNFTNWDEEDLDEDDFMGFREGPQGSRDVFVTSYYLLRRQFMAVLMGTLQQGGVLAWQTIEAAVFVLYSVAADVRKRLDEDPSSADLAADQQATAQMVFQFFQELTTNTALSSNPLVVLAICRLIGAFDQWFEKPGPAAVALPVHPKELIGGVLQYLSNALLVPEARSQAATALGRICVGCRARLASDTAILDSLVESLEKAAAAGLSVKDRESVTVGIVRVTATLQATPGQAVLGKLATTMIQRLGGALAQIPAAGAVPDGVVKDTIMSELQLLATSIQFLDSPIHSAADGSHMALPLVAMVWPLLQQSSGSCVKDNECMGHVLALYTSLLGSFKQAMASKLSELAQVIVSCFQQSHFPGALDCLAKAVEIFGQPAESAETFKAILSMISQSVFAYVQSGYETIAYI
jgi:hypothetical protein